MIYLRFKDDIFVVVNGNYNEMIHCIEIISTRYPTSIQLSSEVNVIHGMFLNLRLYNVSIFLN